MVTKSILVQRGPWGYTYKVGAHVKPPAPHDIVAPITAFEMFKTKKKSTNIKFFCLLILAVTSDFLHQCALFPL